MPLKCRPLHAAMPTCACSLAQPMLSAAPLHLHQDVSQSSLRSIDGSLEVWLLMNLWQIFQFHCSFKHKGITAISLRSPFICSSPAVCVPFDLNEALLWTVFCVYFTANVCGVGCNVYRLGKQGKARFKKDVSELGGSGPVIPPSGFGFLSLHI